VRWDVVAFGETMIRLAVPTGERLETARQLEVGIGGAEANVLVALARLGRRTAWASVLPKQALGERIVRELAWHGVETSLVQWVEQGRVGVYYLDVGIPPRPTTVLYDRTGSAVAAVDPASFPIGLGSPRAGGCMRQGSRRRSATGAGRCSSGWSNERTRRESGSRST